MKSREPNSECMLFVLNAYEQKLRELMGDEAYLQFAKSVAQKGVRKEIEAMPDSDFKRFCLDNFDEVTEG